MSTSLQAVAAITQRKQITYNGDSIIGLDWRLLASSEITASQTGGLATITLANHAIPPNTHIHMDGWSDPLWNGTFTVLVAGVTANTFNFEIDPAASASPTDGTFVANFTIPVHQLAEGVVNWATWLSGMDLGKAYNAAIGSRLMSDMVAAFQRDVAPQGPGGLLLQGGPTNDCKNAVATATSLSGTEELFIKARKIGMRTMALTVPPLLGATNTTARANAILAYNAGERELTTEMDLKLGDWYSLLVAGASTEAAAATGMVDPTDLIHTTPRAAKMLAEAELIPWFTSMGFGSPTPLVSSVADTVGTLTSSTNMLPAMAGTGGSVSGTGASGQIFTGWTGVGAITGGAATTVFTVEAGPVNSLVHVDISGTGGSFTITGPSILASLEVGDWISFCGLVDVNMPTAFRMTLSLNLIAGGVTYQIRPISTSGVDRPLPAGNYSLCFNSEPWQLPAGWRLTSVVPAAVVVPTGACIGRISFSQFTPRAAQ